MEKSGQGVKKTSVKKNREPCRNKKKTRRNCLTLDTAPPFEGVANEKIAIEIQTQIVAVVFRWPVVFRLKFRKGSQYKRKFA